MSAGLPLQACSPQACSPHACWPTTYSPQACSPHARAHPPGLISPCARSKPAKQAWSYICPQRSSAHTSRVCEPPLVSAAGTPLVVWVFVPSEDGVVAWRGVVVLLVQIPAMLACSISHGAVIIEGGGHARTLACAANGKLSNLLAF